MFVVLLRFAACRELASRFMKGHQEWIRRGFADGVFLVAGSLAGDSGGGILAHNASLPDLRERVREDPFVAQGVVTAEIVEIAPFRCDERLSFMLGSTVHDSSGRERRA